MLCSMCVPHVAARVVTYVLACCTCAYTSASTCSSTRASWVAHVVTHVLARAIMHVHDDYLKTCVPGAYSDRFLKNSEPGNTPKEWFLSWKRLKEGERVVLGHFHERVGESPGRLDTRILAPADLKNLFWFPSLTGPNHISLTLENFKKKLPVWVWGESKSYLGNAQINLDFDSVGLPWVWEL